MLRNKASLEKLLYIIFWILTLLSWGNFIYWGANISSKGIDPNVIPYFWLLFYLFFNPIPVLDIVKKIIWTIGSVYFCLLIGSLYIGVNALSIFLCGCVCFLLLLLIFRNWGLRKELKELEKIVPHVDLMYDIVDNHSSWFGIFEKFVVGCLSPDIYNTPISYDKVIELIEKEESEKKECEDGSTLYYWSFCNGLEEFDIYVNKNFVWNPTIDLKLCLRFKDNNLIEIVKDESIFNLDNLKVLKDCLMKMRGVYMDRIYLIRSYLK
jgi:hypothetical protein